MKHLSLKKALIEEIDQWVAGQQASKVKQKHFNFRVKFFPKSGISKIP
jgi:hypothetical protein